MAPTTGIVQLELRDSIGKRYSFRGYIDASSNTYDEMVGTAQSLAHSIDVLTEAQIVAARLSVPLDISGFAKVSPVSGSEINIGAIARFHVGLRENGYSVWVPAWKRGNFVGDVANFDAAYHDIARFSMSLGGSPPWFATAQYEALSVETTAKKSIHEGLFGSKALKFK